MIVSYSSLNRAEVDGCSENDALRCVAGYIIVVLTQKVDGLSYTNGGAHTLVPVW